MNLLFSFPFYTRNPLGSQWEKYLEFPGFPGNPSLVRSFRRNAKAGSIVYWGREGENPFLKKTLF
jgi:hypothetical protein